jgi:uncharacterized protein (DUF983 family)
MRLALRALGRGLLRRCPRCGRGGLFSGFFTLRARCPTCGLRFEREEGYWVGAMIVNLAGTMIAFFVVLMGGILLWWPDVPWGVLTMVTVAVCGAVPVLFYPWSKTIWMALDVLLHRMDAQDHDAAGNGDAGPQVFDGRELRP